MRRPPGVSGGRRVVWQRQGSNCNVTALGFAPGGDRLAVGFGFIYVLGSNDIEGWPLVPWVDFAVNW